MLFPSPWGSLAADVGPVKTHGALNSRVSDDGGGRTSNISAVIKNVRVYHIMLVLHLYLPSNAFADFA
jgi:Zn-dependent protease